jgi:hypothetical protein
MALQALGAGGFSQGKLGGGMQSAKSGAKGNSSK